MTYEKVSSEIIDELYRSAPVSFLARLWVASDGVLYAKSDEEIAALERKMEALTEGLGG